MRNLKSTIVSLFLFTGGMLSASAQDANTILEKMDDVMYSPKDMTGKTKKAVYQFEKIGKYWNAKEVVFIYLHTICR